MSHPSSQSSTLAIWYLRRPTFHLLLAVACEGANDSILLSRDAVGCAIGKGLSPGGLVLYLALSVLLARLGPGTGAGEVTDGLDDNTLERVILTGGLPIEDVT